MRSRATRGTAADGGGGGLTATDAANLTKVMAKAGALLESPLEKRRLTSWQRKKKAADQKAFHETTRRKKAEAALVKEKEKRHKEEYEATEMQRNAEHARQGMNEALERAKMASSDLKAKTDAAKTSAPTEARTAFESKQRAIYGAGEGKKVFAARGAA